jgi:competence protein ComFC
MNQLESCLLCGKRLNALINWSTLLQRYPQAICLDCHEQFIRMNQTEDEIYCLYQYNDKMKQYFKQYKFQQDVVLAMIFAETINRYFQQILKQNPRMKIVPIPLHSENEQKRTFSQVETLLQVADIKYESILVKQSAEQQAKKTRKERLMTKNLFCASREVVGESFVVFDDIKTTGVTLHLAKQTLLDAGAKKVKLVALAGGIKGII